METLPTSKGAKSKDGNPLKPSTYIKPSEFPPPSKPLTEPIKTRPALYSSSLVSQSDNCKDQTVLVFPDWKVVSDVENSRAGAKALYDTELGSTVGRAGLTLSSGGGGDGVFRKRSHVMPYRAIVLLCELMGSMAFEKNGLAPASPEQNMADAQARTRRVTSAVVLPRLFCVPP